MTSIDASFVRSCDKTAQRGVRREAEKQRQLMRVLFRWALGQDIIESDPTAGLATTGIYRPPWEQTAIISPSQLSNPGRLEIFRRSHRMNAALRL